MTGETRRVHKTRIVENLDTGDSKISVSEEMRGTIVAKSEKKATKAIKKAAKKSVKKEAVGGAVAEAPKKAPKKAPKGVELDMNDLKSEGEVYRKALLFDWEHVTAQSYVIIAEDNNSFRTLNVYNNRVTEKGRKGVQYNLKPDGGADKKRTQLIKKGYEKI